MRPIIRAFGYRFFTAMRFNAPEMHAIGGNAVTDPLQFQPGTAPRVARPDAALREVAQKLEAGFLSEMLRHTGLGEEPGEFGGGTGADQFASFHRQVLAERMVEAGGIGLAESFLRALMERRDDA